MTQLLVPMKNGGGSRQILSVYFYTFLKIYVTLKLYIRNTFETDISKLCKGENNRRYG